MKIFKVAFVLIFCLLLIGAIALLVQEAPEAPKDGYYTYTISNGKATIESCDQTATGELIVPSVLGTFPVTTIGAYAFDGCINVTDIKLPDSVTEIQMYAFENCTSLVNIHIPDSVASIDRDAFGNCPSLAGIWVDEGNTKYASDDSGVLFYKDMVTLIRAPMALTDPYIIPTTVQTIGERAFQGCSNLTNIIIPDGITSIDWYTFSDCTALKVITIPHSLTSIGYEVFRGCNSLTKVNFKGTEDDWGKISVKTGNNPLNSVTFEYNYCQHTFDSGTVTKPVSCKEDGVRSYTCTQCGRIKLETIPKLEAHDWDEGVKTKAPTCKESGTITYTCTICNTKKTSDIPALDTHTFGAGVTTKEPTCKEPGTMTYTCRYCGMTKEETIIALTTHTPGPPATSTTDQVCTVCGTVLVPATGTPEPTEPTTEPSTEPSQNEDPGNDGGFFGGIADFFNSIGSFFEDMFSSFFSLLGF
ncbi:MAG: leucine-rich repeat domain-containing protein [Ruminococcaceae bacterium]|nr:leucine-rich repeat domain-containing protein [Oscillospiraceae bacterium]